MKNVFLIMTIFLTSTTATYATENKIPLFSQLNMEKQIQISQAKIQPSINSSSIFKLLDINNDNLLDISEFMAFIY